MPDGNDLQFKGHPRDVFASPYFWPTPLAEWFYPAVLEAAQTAIPQWLGQSTALQDAVNQAVSSLAVLRAGDVMNGPLGTNFPFPTMDNKLAAKIYVDMQVATSVPEVPSYPPGQVWSRMYGEWVPGGGGGDGDASLPIAGGTMQGQINMSGNTIVNMAAIPVMPNGAAPAQWVLNQIAAQSLYQGTWDADNNVPDLTQSATHQNSFTWIATTTATGGVVIGQAIPGLQGQTVFNGDTIIYSAMQGVFNLIHAGGMSFTEAQAYFLALSGGQLSGPLLLNANASQPMQAVTLQQLQAFVPPGGVSEAPNDGQLYGRNGLMASWAPVLPLAGGILTGSLTLFGNATQNLQAVPLQQLNSAISAGVAGYLPLSGGTMTGLLSLSGNAANALNPVPLQQLSGMLGAYVPTSGNVTMTGPLTMNGPATLPNQPATLQQLNNAPYIPQNYCDNSGFTVNQRAYTSGTALPAGVFGFDRWKAGSSGATLTFTDSPAATVITITAGSIVQVIEGLNILSATYTFSWTGTATGRVYAGVAGGAFAASPLQITPTAAVDLSLEFTGGTVSRVQLQLGNVATPWQPLPTLVELARCQRFYIGQVSYSWYGSVTYSGSYGGSVYFPTMRALPNCVNQSFTGAGVSFDGGLSIYPQDFNSAIVVAATTGPGNIGNYNGYFTASADL